MKSTEKEVRTLISIMESKGFNAYKEVREDFSNGPQYTCILGPLKFYRMFDKNKIINCIYLFNYNLDLPKKVRETLTIEMLARFADPDTTEMKKRFERAGIVDILNNK